MAWYYKRLIFLGYYRVIYDLNNWNILIKQLYDDSKYNTQLLNRAQIIIDDALNLAKVNKIDYTLVLKLPKYLKNEDDVIP